MQKQKSKKNQNNSPRTKLLKTTIAITMYVFYSSAKFDIWYPNYDWEYSKYKICHLFLLFEKKTKLHTNEIFIQQYYDYV